MTLRKKPVIFSDFDGTITQRDVIITIMDKYAPKEWINIKDKILYERTITLREGIELLFNLIDSSKKDEITKFIKKEVQLRDGFSNFIDYCIKNNIEFNVLSGGLDFHIYPILEDFKDKIKIFCNHANFNSEKIKIDYKYLPKNCTLCGDCGCCKIELIEKYPSDQFYKIVIGDSLTDFPPSKVADIVFARADLIKYIDEENDLKLKKKEKKLKYITFETFYDIKIDLEKIIGEE